MQLPVVKDKLEKFGSVEIYGADDGDIVFHVETTLDGAETIETLARTVDNMGDATLGIAGNNRGDALIEVRVQYEAFDVIPPYLEDK